MNNAGVAWALDLGAAVTGLKGAYFRIWAPLADEVSVKLLKDGATETPLEKDERGYFAAHVPCINAGDDYLYVLNRRESYPDPASRLQPNGVHGPSRIVDPNEFHWQDHEWKGMPLQEFIIYELHVGTFTEEGTFSSVIRRLEYMAELGITALELMPVAQFPGNRNWGYDGAYPFAPQNTYGGPAGLKELINAAHKAGIAVILDVVYNHLGPEGSYLHHFGPYYTDKYKTPWGSAMNFDGPYSDEVRRFFISNALYWLTEYHVDALRLDAVHGIFDFSARHFLEELGETVHSTAKKLGKKFFLIAESDLNDARIINSRNRGGYAMNAQWNDDFHHSLHAVLTGERDGYYMDFGNMRDIEKALRDGYVYSGKYSRYRKKSHGNSSKEHPSDHFIIYSQSHDQVGNRPGGDRLSMTQPVEKLKLAAAAVLLSPYIPLLFMGEEYGETAPFPYFVSHSDPALVEAVREGRKMQFEAAGWTGTHPDPQAEDTFLASKLSPDLRNKEPHRELFLFYKKLIELRKNIPSLCRPCKDYMEAACMENERAIIMMRWYGNDEVFCIYNFSDDVICVTLFPSEKKWLREIDSSEKKWGGPGHLSPESLGTAASGMPVTLRANCFCMYRISGGKP